MPAIAKEAAIADYLIEAGTSRFTVRGFAGGLLSGLGHNPVVAIPDFAGEARWDPEDPQTAYLSLRIRAASLSVQNDISEKDRREMQRVMLEEVLEVDGFPEIVFESTAASANANNRVELDGNLSLHGVTRRERVTVQVAVTGDMLRAFGDFSIRQSDYRIKPASVAGGALKLKDELKFTFDIVARKKTE
ncbi:MAG: YceI family protein [Bryobacteraceae bacterium]|jgi:polyisoprenoid-binding protein YceI